MNRSWVTVAVALVAVLSAGLLARQCSRRSNTAVEDGQAREQFASRDRAGSARPGAAADRLARRRAADSDDASSSDDSDTPESIADAMVRARQRAGLGRASGSGRSLAAGPGLDDGDQSLDAAGAPVAGGANGATAPQRAAEAAQAAAQAAAAPGAAAPAATAGADDDPNAPALSLKLDKSTLPEKGETAPLAEGGIIFDRQGAYFGEDAVLAMPSTDKVQGTAGTISFWVQPDWVGESDTNAALFQWRSNTFENRIQIFKNGPFLRFLFCDNTGTESGVGYNIIHWKEKEWHAITATWGDGITALYVDGTSVGAQEYNGELLIPPGTPWFFGSDHAGGAPGARSRIAGFEIFPRALAADEIPSAVAQNRPQQ